MPETRKIAAIVNPSAAGGKAGKRWPAMHCALEQRLGPVTVRFTAANGHATEITRELLGDGFNLIVAVGGDGTVNEIANGFLNRDVPVRPEASLGILPVGTGSDLQRTLGIPPRFSDAVELLANGRPVPIDIGKTRFRARDETIQDRYFVNLVSFGMGGAVAAGAKNFLRPLGGKIAFLWSTFIVLLRYHGRNVKLRLDGCAHEASYFVTNVAVGNGRYHGGGMHPCPTAVINDGMLEVTVIEYMSMLRLVYDIRVLYSENVYRHPKTRHLRATSLSATGDPDTLIEIDGEPLGRLPLEITLLPRRLPIVVSRNSPLAQPHSS